MGLAFGDFLQADAEKRLNEFETAPSHV